MHSDDWNRYGDDLDSVPQPLLGDDGMSQAEHRQLLALVGLLFAAAALMAWFSL